jgi:acyl carrier protein
MTQEQVTARIKAEISRETGLAISEIDDGATFYSLGLDSVSSVYILDKLEKQLNVEMNPLFFWDYPTVGLFAEYITTLPLK